MADWRRGNKAMSDLADEVERLAHQQLPVEPDPFDVAVSKARGELRRLLDVTMDDIECGFFDPDVATVEARMRASDAKRAATFKKVIKPGDPPIGRIWPRDDHQAEREAVFLASRQEGASTDEAAQTLAAWERTYHAQDRAHTVRLGPVEVSAEPEGLRFTRTEREPRGPLTLRWRLWRMRRRLWWMRARLDGTPVRALGLAGVVSTAITTLAVALTALGDAPDPWRGWAYAPVSALASWVACRGWRTPTVNKIIEEAG